jgi:hypothetical protein
MINIIYEKYNIILILIKMAIRNAMHHKTTRENWTSINFHEDVSLNC